MADGMKKNSVSLLFLLYFLQGLPYGFQVKFLPLLLRARNLSLSRVGLTRLLSVPWVLKFLIAPLVDRSGLLHLWISSSLAGMAALFCFSAVAGINDASTLLCCVFGLNVLSAAQDVAVDALAMQRLKSCDLGKGNTAQVVGYKVGALVGGGVLAWLVAFTDWELLLGGVSCLYAILAAFFFLRLGHCQQTASKSERTNEVLYCGKFVTNRIAEHEGDYQHIKKGDNSLQDKAQCQRYEITEHSQSVGNVSLSHQQKTRQLTLLGVFRSLTSGHGFVWLVVYVTVYKLGEQGVVSMWPLFLLDQGFSKGHVGFISGIGGQAFSIIGSTFGGWLINQHCNKRAWLIKILFWMSVARLFPLTAQWLSTWFETNLVLAIVLECTLQFIAGVITTTTFTLMMSVSQESADGVQATHFSTLATVEVVGKLLMISLSGALVDWVGYRTFFGLCSALALAVLPILHQVPFSILKSKEF